MHSNNSEDTEDINVSLSPERGSLFHSYHSKFSSDKNTCNDKGKGRSFEVFNMTKKPRFPSGRSFRNFSISPEIKMENYPNLEMTDLMMAQEEAKKHCSKTFHLKDSSTASHAAWTLPPAEHLYKHKIWKIDELLSMKEDLNTVKGQLEEYDLEEWHKHTHFCNPASKISPTVRYKAKPELLTQAFLKFYEILHAFPIVPDLGERSQSSFKSLHLCEAPGAFVVALNHFLSLQRPNVRKWDWIGNTLNPHFEGTPSSECIADDRFILYTLDNWFFGKDETGNLMNPDYMEELQERMGGSSKMDLVTADGSIDCQGNPAEQEAMTHCLHFCEVYAALKSLRIGGCLVVKKFTFFEVDSVNLVYLICCCFNNVYIYKPTTSKLGNSEVYLVALEYNPPSSMSEYWSELSKHYGNHVSDGCTMFNVDQVSPGFISQIICCSEFFKKHQVAAIERNIMLHSTRSEHQTQYTELLKSCVLAIFLERNCCQPIDSSKQIVKKRLEWDRHIIPERANSKWGVRILNKAKDERLQYLDFQFNECGKLYNLSNILSKCEYQSYEFQQIDTVTDSLSLKSGKSFHFVYVSRFCHANLLQILIYYFLDVVSAKEADLAKINHCKLSVCNAKCDSDFSKKIKDIKQKFLLEYPDVEVMDERLYPCPHNCINVFSSILDIIYEGNITKGKSFMLFNCPLLTRLQVGLLLLLSTLFEKAKLHFPDSPCDWPPFITLENFLSVEKGHSLTKSLEDSNCLKGQMYSRFNQVLPLKFIINSPSYSQICKYNSSFCIFSISSLRNYIKDQ